MKTRAASKVKILLSITGVLLFAGVLLVFVLQKPDRDDPDNTQSNDSQPSLIAPTPDTAPLPADLQPPANASEIAEGYIGLSEAEAVAKATQDNKTSRVVARDEETIPITLDYSPSRLNFSLQNGLVTKVDFY